jgi:hypothetical protein
MNILIKEQEERKVNDIIVSVISIVVTSVVLPLITLGGTRLIQFLNQKIKDEKTRTLLTGLTSIIERAVRSVFQTYVEALKKNNSFDKEAQVKALELARSEVTKQLSNETASFIKETYGDVNTFIISQIEATINLLKV